MERNDKCTGICMGCTILQRGLCSAQIAYNNSKAINDLSMELKTLGEKIAAMQNSETSLFNPTANTAQQGDGVI